MKGKEKTTIEAETIKPHGKPIPRHYKDKKPGLVQSKIEEFTAKFNPATQGTKPPDSKPSKDALAPFPIFRRRPSSKEMGQGTSAVGTIVHEPRLVEIGNKGDL